jgi:hypothetical protein
MKCLKCGYERQPQDHMYVPATECPACGVVYVKSGAAQPKPSKTATLPTLRKTSPLDESTLKQARQRVEMRLRKKTQSRIKDERHALTLERARRIAAAETSKRLATQNRQQPEKEPPREAPCAPLATQEDNLPITAGNLDSAAPPSITTELASPSLPFANTNRNTPPTQEDENKPHETLSEKGTLTLRSSGPSNRPNQGTVQTRAQNFKPAPTHIDERSHTELIPDEKIIIRRVPIEKSPPKKEENIAMEKTPALQTPKEKPRSSIIKKRKLSSHHSHKGHAKDSPVDREFGSPEDNAFRSDQRQPSSSGVMRMLSFVAWLILVAGVVGMGLSWITLGTVEAGIHSEAPTGLGTMPLGLLLGFAYLATGVLGFAFFWVASLITRQLRDIRRLLLIQQPSNYFSDNFAATKPRG